MRVRTQNTKARANRKSGFSLAELMVVIVIIGLLVTLVAKNVFRNLATANSTKAGADIASIVSSLNEYAISNGMRFPDSLEALVTPDESGYSYLSAKKVPTDPWGNEYQYDPPAPGTREPIVYSFGSDGARGGDGDAADISSADE